MPSSLMEHGVNPKQEILERVGDISDVEIFGNDILVALYVRPEKTRGGILLSDQTREEDKFQGKCGLILKLGPTAYLDEDGNRFRDISEGDFVVFRPSDGWPVTLNSKKDGLTSKEAAIPCRVITDINIRMRVLSPDAIY